MLVLSKDNNYSIIDKLKRPNLLDWALFIKKLIIIYDNFFLASSKSMTSLTSSPLIEA